LLIFLSAVLKSLVDAPASPTFFALHKEKLTAHKK